MREIVLAVVMLSAGLVGCIGDGGESLDSTQANATNGSATVADTSEADATNNTTASNTTQVSDNGTAPESNETDELNPWQQGLDDDYPTPPIAENRSREERRSNVAEPGDPEFAAFDARMTSWMEEHNITTGQLAVMKDGKLAYERGYGHVDRAETEPTNASTMFRIASVTKPMTAALVSMQVEQGLYNWTDPVLCLGEDPAPDCRLPIDPHPTNPVEDDRLAEMQVRHLVNHTGGWAGSANHLTFGEGAIEVARELGIESPPSAWRTVQYLMGEELAHDPGGGENPYCNPCYMTAGLVAEAATGAELGALYDAYLFEPLEIEGDIEPGRMLLEERNPREPFYACDEDGGSRETRNVFDPNETSCPADGRWSLQTQLAQGGLIATASAVAAVYELYAHHGYRLLNFVPEDVDPFNAYFHGGGNPGTSAMAMTIADEVGNGGKFQYVFLFNTREKGEHCQETESASPTCDRASLEVEMAGLTATWGASQNVLPASLVGGSPTGPR